LRSILYNDRWKNRKHTVPLDFLEVIITHSPLISTSN
jgi:hypothetical protein